MLDMNEMKDRELLLKRIEEDLSIFHRKEADLGCAGRWYDPQLIGEVQSYLRQNCKLPVSGMWATAIVQQLAEDCSL